MRGPLPQLPQSPQQVPCEQLVLQHATPEFPQKESEVQAMLQNSLPSWSVEQYWFETEQTVSAPLHPSWLAPSSAQQM